MLLIAPEEIPFSQGMLCYRHLCTVAEIAARVDVAHHNQAKLKFLREMAWEEARYLNSQTALEH